jgi:hypothetical protein
LSPTETIIQCTQQITAAMQQLYCDHPPAPLTQADDHFQALANFHSIFQTIPSVPQPAPLLRVSEPTAEEPPTTVEAEVQPAEQPQVFPPTITTIVQQHLPTLSYLEEPSPHSDATLPRRSQRNPIPSQKILDNLNQHLAASALNVDTGKLCEYRQLLKSSMGPLWEKASCEEWARLAQGLPTHNIPVTEGTNTILFIAYENVPLGCIATYPRVVVADKPHKANPIRVRITIGGDRITYLDEVSTKTADLATAKILLNSTISTPDARWMTVDIKDFYLNTPMSKFEYMKVPITLFPPDIIAHYLLEKIAHKGFVYCEIQ